MQGQPETLEYRCFIQQKGAPDTALCHLCHSAALTAVRQNLRDGCYAGQSISPWHDIPLNAENGQLNFVCEIPKESSAKMEVATVRPLSPGFCPQLLLHTVHVMLRHTAHRSLPSSLVDKRVCGCTLFGSPS